MAAIPTTDIIAEEGEDNWNEDPQQSGGGTIHTRLYRLRKSVDRTRQMLVNRGEEERLKDCAFQPNVDRITEKKADTVRLSDQTRVGNTTWAILKKKALREDYS